MVKVGKNSQNGIFTSMFLSPMIFFENQDIFPWTFNWAILKIGRALKSVKKNLEQLSSLAWKLARLSNIKINSVILVVQYKIILWIDQTRGQGTAEMAALDSKATQKAFRSSAGPSVLLLLWQMMSIVLQDLTQKASWQIQSIVVHCAQILFLDSAYCTLFVHWYTMIVHWSYTDCTLIV